MTDRSPTTVAFTGQDAAGTLRALGTWWSLTVADVDPAATGPLVREQVAVLRRALGGEVGAADPADPITAVGTLASVLQRRVAEGAVDPSVRDEVVASSLSLLREAGRALAAAGAFVPGTGVVHGLFTSPGGVPKLPVDQVEVGPRGLAGDRQAAHRHHGRPWQALCLWSFEVVERLRREGHPLAPGRAGENVSIAGLDWTTVRPGTRLRLGDQVRAEVTVPALPCKKNAGWFLGGDFTRMHHEREPGVARMYAWVLSSGTLRVGDEVALEP